VKPDVVAPQKPSGDVGLDDEEALAQHVEAEETSAESNADDVVRDCWRWEVEN
jgi:hypothetical protein